jgi:hypothetical protein
VRIPGRRSAEALRERRARNQAASSFVARAEARGRLRARIDAAVAAMSQRAWQRRGEELQRRLGITRVGQIAFVGAVIAVALGRIVAGTAMYILGYGACCCWWPATSWPLASCG